MRPVYALPLAVTLVLSWPLFYAPAAVASRPFRLLTLDDLSSSATAQVDSCQNYFGLDGDKNRLSSEAHVADMAMYGFNEAAKLIAKHHALVRPGAAILEVSPYYSPLSSVFGSKGHPCFAWEYDTSAARHLLTQNPKTVLFQADLNKFTSADWLTFVDRNVSELIRVAHRENFGAVILSSVLNYFDYKQGLREIIPMIGEGGLLVVANSNIGDTPFFRKGQYPPTAPEVLETLLRDFPGQLSLLDGSSVDSSGHMSRIFVAARVSWQANPRTEDVYAKGLGYLVDDLDRTIYRMNIVDSLGTLRSDARHYSYRFDPNYEEDVRYKRWSTVGSTLITAELTRRHRDLWHLSRCARDSSEADAFKKALDGVGNYHFIPERHLLLQALKIPDPQVRRNFLKAQLGAFFAKLGHEMPDLDGPDPELFYPQIDESIFALQQLNR